ncbi:MAG: o-succinylbenzoate--CoA ligase [Candidatus Hydrogenedentota bacterium]
MAPLLCPVARSADRWPNAPALREGERLWSWAEMDDAATRIAGVLGERGFKPGDRVAFALPAEADTVLLFWGCLRAGLAVCPLNMRVPPERRAELAGMAGCKTTLTGTETEHVSRLAQAASVDGTDEPPGVEDQPATIVYTSGSSGAPKAAVHTFSNHVHSARASNQRVPLRQGDSWLLSLPLYHVSGIAILFRCAEAGAETIVPAKDMPLPEAIAAHRPTHLSLVPAQLQRVLDEDPAVLAHVKAVLLGGGPIPQRLLERAVAEGVPIHITYGMTETASQIATTPRLAPGDLPNPGALPLLPGAVRVADDGEIEVSGPTLFMGYLKGDGVERPETEAGWFPTGDLGCFDERGWLHVTGRRDNLFISGGENIQPEEIEAELARLPEIAEALVVPVTDKTFGARPAAFVRANSGAADSAAIAAALATRLPKYKIPIAFLPWPPEAGEGLKPSRRQFAEWADRRLAEKGK